MSVLTSTQAEIAVGYGELGASELGSQFAFYRQSQSTCDFSSPYLTQGAAIDYDPLFTFKKVFGYGKPTYFGAFDYTDVQAGDYLVGSDTYFVATIPFPQPPMLVRCNTTLSFWGAAADVTGDPDDDYESNTATAGKGAQLASGWPASMLAGSRGEKPTMELPISSREPWVSILVPTLPVTLAEGDFARDPANNRFLISDVEQSHLGLRITAKLTEA